MSVGRRRRNESGKQGRDDGYTPVNETARMTVPALVDRRMTVSVGRRRRNESGKQGRDDGYTPVNKTVRMTVPVWTAAQQGKSKSEIMTISPSLKETTKIAFKKKKKHYRRRSAAAQQDRRIGGEGELCCAKGGTGG